MIYGFKGNKTTTAEEWLIDYSLRTGNAVNVNTNLLDTPIIFDGKEVDAFILDIIDNKLVIQIVLPLKSKFDDKSNRYETSYVRKLINSKDFLNRFNPKFAKHIKPTRVHTEDYVTNDKLWLLSHEEIFNMDVSGLKPNHECHAFEMFKTVDLTAYSRMLLRLNEKKSYGWWLRSACSSTSYISHSINYVGCINGHGYVWYSWADNDQDGTLLPVCTIC